MNRDQRNRFNNARKAARQAVKDLNKLADELEADIDNLCDKDRIPHAKIRRLENEQFMCYRAVSSLETAIEDLEGLGAF